MKKFIVLALLLLCFVTPVLAEEAAQEQMPAPQEESGMGMPPQMGMGMGVPRGMGGMGMGMGMMGMAGKASMVASNDGGVIVLMGNKLMKYDADLNLKKEATLKMPMMGDKMCPLTKPAAGEGETAAAGTGKKSS